MEENNKLIAEFMGYIYNAYLYHPSKTWYSDGYEDLDTIYSKVLIEIYSNEPNTVDFKWFFNNTKEFKTKLGYDCDWQELMEVVEKIESLKVLIKGEKDSFKVAIVSNLCRIFRTLTGEDTVKHDHTIKNKFEAVYQAVVKFIKWYNANVKYQILEKNEK